MTDNHNTECLLGTLSFCEAGLYCIIKSSQHSFMKGKSCLINLLKLLEGVIGRVDRVVPRVVHVIPAMRDVCVASKPI